MCHFHALPSPLFLVISTNYALNAPLYPQHSLCCTILFISLFPLFHSPAQCVSHSCSLFHSPTQCISLSFSLFLSSVLESEVYKPSEILIKNSNAIEYIESDIQKMIPSTSICMIKHDDMVLFKEFLKLFKYLAFSGTHTVSELLDLFFKALHQERKRRKGRILARHVWAP